MRALLTYTILIVKPFVNVLGNFPGVSSPASPDRPQTIFQKVLGVSRAIGC